MRVRFKVVRVQVEGKGVLRWVEELHPRDWRGRFSDKPSSGRPSAGGSTSRSSSGARATLSVRRPPSGAVFSAPSTPGGDGARAVKVTSLTPDQRHGIIAPFDRDGQSPEVRETARRIKDGEPVDAAQVRALAEAVRVSAADAPSGQARLMERTARRLDDVHLHLEGIDLERLPDRDRAVKTLVDDLVEGDMVALPGPDGTVRVRKVVSSKKGNRGWQVAVEDADGRDRHQIPWRTELYVLPDLPDHDSKAAVEKAADEVSAEDAEQRHAREHLAANMAQFDIETRTRIANTAAFELGRLPDDTPENLAAKVEEALRKTYGQPGTRTGGLLNTRSLVAAENALTLPEGTSDDQRQQFGFGLTPVFRDVEDRAREDAIRELTETIRQSRPSSPDQNNAKAAAAALGGYTRRDKNHLWEPKDYNQAAAVLAAATRREAEPDTPAATGIPEFPPDTPLAERMAAYRQGLGSRFGHRTEQLSTFETITLADLEAGKLPQVNTNETLVQDRAADGGPGQHTMRQLEILRAAGADLDAELQRRIKADPQGDSVAKRKELQELEDLLTEEIRAEEQAADDRYAQSRGFADAAHLQTRFRESIGTHEASNYRKLLSDGDDYRQKAVEGLQKDLDETRAQIAELATIPGDVQRRHIIDILNEARPTGMGGAGIQYSGVGTTRPLPENNRLVEAMRYAEAGYPTDWLQRPNRGLTLAGATRAYHHRGRREIGLSSKPGLVKDAGESGTAADHELGHHMEDHVPGLLEAEEALLWDRTSTGRVGSRVREKPTKIPGTKREMTRRDRFPRAYTGRDYQVDNHPAHAYEIFSTVKESLTSGQTKYLDDDLRRWGLGVLALV